MEGELIIGLVAVIGVIVVPSLAIAVRLSLKPMVEAVVKLREATGRTGSLTQLGDETAEIRAQLNRLEATVQKLSETEAFYRELRAPHHEAQALAEGGQGTGEGAPR